MKKLLICAALAAATMTTPTQAGIIDWVLKTQVEDAVEEEVKKALVKAITKGTSKGKAKSTSSKPTPVPVAGKVQAGDYRWLPLTGGFRFPVPEDKNLKALKIGPSGGYLDRFGSEWIPYRTNGKIVAWRSNLSERGQLRMRALSNGKKSILIGKDGKEIPI